MDWTGRHDRSVLRMTLLSAAACAGRHEAALQRGLREYLNPREEVQMSPEGGYYLPDDVAQKIRITLADGTAIIAQAMPVSPVSDDLPASLKAWEFCAKHSMAHRGADCYKCQEGREPTAVFSDAGVRLTFGTPPKSPTLLRHSGLFAETKAAAIHLSVMKNHTVLLNLLKMFGAELLTELPAHSAPRFIKLATELANSDTHNEILDKVPA